MDDKNKTSVGDPGGPKAEVNQKAVGVIWDKDGKPKAVLDETSLRYRLVDADPENKVQEQWYYIGKLPKENCKKCYGTGLVGREITTNKYIPCKCIGGVGDRAPIPNVTKAEVAPRPVPKPQPEAQPESKIWMPPEKKIEVPGEKK